MKNKKLQKKISGSSLQKYKFKKLHINSSLCRKVLVPDFLYSSYNLLKWKLKYFYIYGFGFQLSIHKLLCLVRINSYEYLIIFISHELAAPSLTTKKPINKFNPPREKTATNLTIKNKPGNQHAYKHHQQRGSICQYSCAIHMVVTRPTVNPIFFSLTFIICHFRLFFGFQVRGINLG